MSTSVLTTAPAPPIGHTGAPAATIAELWARLWEWANVHPSGDWFFRGQGAPWPVVPKIGRKGYGYDASRERSMFKAFVSSARPLVATVPANEWEWLALAQHHGMPTRLLDWSTNVLVACWFAVTSGSESDEAIVYALEAGRSDVATCDIVTGEITGGSHIHSPLNVTSGVYLFESSPVSPRITSQRGIFTAHGSPTTELSIPEEHKFSVPANLRVDMQAQLLDIGVDASHIYPGIDGLCQTLDWRFKSGKGFSALT